MYEIELWDANGVQLADIGHLAQGIKFSLGRNIAEDLSFTIDLDAFEQYCDSIGEHPRNIIEPDVTDVKVKRDGTYLFGAQVQEAPGHIDKDSGKIEVKASGYLNLFKDAYVTKVYGVEATPSSWVEATTIARDLILTQQAKTNGDFGVTMDALQYNTGVTRFRNYDQQNVKDAIVNLTDLVDGNFDFNFTYDRKFQTFALLGSDRPDSPLLFPGNIVSLGVPRSGLTVFNYITGKSTGVGTSVLTSAQQDTISQVKYGRREKPVNFSNIVEQSTLDQNTQAYLADHKDILDLPDITVNGSNVDLLAVMPGNRIPVSVEGYKYLEDIGGTYRVEKVDVTLDSNHNETIILTLEFYV